MPSLVIPVATMKTRLFAARSTRTMQPITAVIHMLRHWLNTQRSAREPVVNAKVIVKIKNPCHGAKTRRQRTAVTVTGHTPNVATLVKNVDGNNDLLLHIIKKCFV